MESLLLTFTLFSFACASVVVITELIRDSLKKKNIRQTKKLGKALKAIKPIVQPMKPVKAQNKNKSKLFLLDEKLAQMGYVSTEQQLGFINWVLNSRLRSVNEVDTKEIQYLFQTIKRYAPNAVETATSDANVASIVKAFGTP